MLLTFFYKVVKYNPMQNYEIVQKIDECLASQIQRDVLHLAVKCGLIDLCSLCVFACYEMYITYDCFLLRENARVGTTKHYISYLKRLIFGKTMFSINRSIIFI